MLQVVNPCHCLRSGGDKNIWQSVTHVRTYVGMYKGKIICSSPLPGGGHKMGHHSDTNRNSRKAQLLFFFTAVLCLKDADGKTNRADPEQTAIC